VVPESFSLVLHESAAAGIPALVSDLGAPAELMRIHGCGRTVEAGNSQAWAAAIQELVDEPEVLNRWKDNLFLPLRIEEEAFFLESVYQRLRCE
jgi:glycosyltransferase involved in cell wall biosynthesis